MRATSILSGLAGDWSQFLQAESSKSYMKELDHFLSQERAAGKSIYPAEELVLAAFNETSLSDVRVVVLGQDPYHGPGQAHGLSFSVPSGVRVPPSLRNIYKELHSDLGVNVPEGGCLLGWARQGVLLLNATLTVGQGCAASHQGRGWELFTDKVLAVLNEQCENLVFMLWGGYAQKKGGFIDESKHLVLRSVHPSPLSAYRGFLGCRHFSQANEYLLSRTGRDIDWSLVTGEEA